MALEIPQVTFNDRPPPAFAGMLADTGPRDVLSRVAESAVDAGLGVVPGTSAGQCKLPANTGEAAKLLGVTIYESQREPVEGSASRYAATDPVPVLAKGRVWVKVDATSGAALVTDGPVYVVHSGAQAGKFRQDTGAGGTAATLVSGAVVRTGGTEGQIAQIELNRP